MRFESVTAYAFGQFRNESLELSPGMNVIYGPNEAGKSTWQAALYAGLCGMRRARGRARTEDAEFEERHKPWDGGGWEVGATIELKDHRVRLRHDLDGRVASSAQDADIAGRDYSGKIMNDGAPDGSRWLGLDRRSFVSTACVRQASILSVLDKPEELQDELQRAAATARTGETAADALALIRTYRSERIGTQRAPTKPLARARQERDSARSALEDAREKQSEAAGRRRDMEKLAVEAQAMEREKIAVEAVLAEAEAEEAERRLASAQTLLESFPDGEPLQPADDSDLADQVSRALGRWDRAPEPEEPKGRSVDELQGLLASEDLGLAILAELDAEAAEERATAARELSAAFPDGAPRRPSEEAELVQAVASALAIWEARPAVSGTPIEELEEQRREIDQQLPAPSSGGVRGILRAILRWFARLFGLARPAPELAPSDLAERRRTIQGEIDDIRRVEEAVRALRDAARRAGVADGAPDALVQGLRQWQEARSAQMHDADERLEDWEQLQRLLGERSLDDIEEEAARLRTEAASRAAIADRRRLTSALATPFDDADIDELRGLTSVARRGQLQDRLDAASELRETALRIASEAPMSEAQASDLRAWLERRREKLAEARDKSDAWGELQGLLGGQTIAEVQEAAEELRRKATSLVERSSPDALRKARDSKPAEADLEELDKRWRAVTAKCDGARGELTEFERDLASVAEAEERVAQAEVEVERLEGLDRTLESASKFLENAQERVHRDIAPVLRKTILERLAQVTDGRYVDCRVDPESLEVAVAGADGHYRSAGLLSHGTAEQIYLLMRLALARHLTAPSGEACPLILDDVVSAADSERKTQLLETLLSISESTQVILFTHEDDVRSWAARRLDGRPNDRLTALSARTA